MVLAEAKVLSSGENESSSPKDQQQNNYSFSSLRRQSSIYSLTLDEFQNTLSESGKNFGSMNMDEFLTSIWTAEENQAVNGSQTCAVPTASTAIDNNGERVMERLPSLSRQASLTLPAPLCRKTVDEVWSEIHKEHRQNDDGEIDDLLNSGSPPRQITLGEMTLEDFLVKAGVVRETGAIGMLQSQPQQFGIPATPFTSVPQGGASMAEPSGYAGNKKRNGVYPLQPVCYGGRVVSNGPGGGGYGETPAMAIGAPVNPVMPDGMVNSQVDNSSNQYGLEIGGLRGRKRMIDGPVEKVVERRQRRMIKNRESAARSRARKQAYTVELEAELNQLREENAHLKQVLAELERKRKQQYLEEFRQMQTKPRKTRQNLRIFKKNPSCHLRKNNQMDIVEKERGEN